MSRAGRPAAIWGRRAEIKRLASWASRTLAIDGDRLIGTVTVETTGAIAQRLGMALHLQGAVRLPAAFDKDPGFATDRPEPFTYGSDVRGATFSDRAEFDVVYGGTLMRATLAVPGDFRVWHGSSPDVPPLRRESLYVELKAPATRATFTTTFAPATK